MLKLKTFSRKITGRIGLALLFAILVPVALFFPDIAVSFLDDDHGRAAYGPSA